MSEFIDFIKFSPSNIVQFDVTSVMYPFQLNRLTLKHSKFTDCKELKRKMRHHLYELNSYLVSGGRLRRWCRPPLMGSPEKILTFLHKSVCLFTLEPGQKSEAHNELPYCKVGWLFFRKSLDQKLLAILDIERCK